MQPWPHSCRNSISGLRQTGDRNARQTEIAPTEVEIWSDNTVDDATATAFMQKLKELLADDPTNRGGDMVTGA